MIRIGVLSLQGCVEPHKKHIEAMGCEFLPVLREEDFRKIDGLIVPGGESTTLLKLLSIYSLEQVFDRFVHAKPTWGICAGAILLAREVVGSSQKSFSAIDLSIERNAYGRQADSFETEVQGYPVAFIRAPLVHSLGIQTKVLAEMNESPVWICEANVMVSMFHPELTQIFPSPMHQRFLELIQKENSVRPSC